MEELKLKDLLTIISHKKISIIVIMIVSIIIGCIYTFNYTTPLYNSTATVILAKVSSTVEGETFNKNITISESDLSLNSDLILTYSELVRSRSVMEEVSNRLNNMVDVGSLMSCVTVNRIGTSDLLQVNALNEDPEIARCIVKEVVDVFSDYVKEIYKIENVYIIDKPSKNISPCNINHPKDILIATCIGICISFAYVYIYTFLDNTIKDSDDIEELLNVKALITIPFDKNKKGELITVNESKSIISEAFKTLRTNIQFSNIDMKGPQTLLITSCLPSEGKSYVSANLAITFSQTGKKVILVDSDMRRGRQAKIFNLPNANGLSNYISNIDSNGMEINWSLGEYIKKTNIKNLDIITAGSVPPNPAELLASSRLLELVNSLKNYYDMIIFDGAPILPIADSLLLGRVLGKVMLVAESNKTKKDNLQTAKTNIEDVGGKVIGIALNKVVIKNAKYGNKYYYYYSEQEEEKTLAEKIKSFYETKVESIKKWAGNVVKKVKTLKKRLGTGKAQENKKVLDPKKEEKNKQKEKRAEEKETKKRIKVVEKEEKIRKASEQAKYAAEEKAKEDAIMAEEKQKREEADAKRKEKERAQKLENKKKRIEENAKKRAEWNKKVKEFKEKSKVKINETKEKLKVKKEEYSKKYEEFKIKRAEENKIKAEEKAKKAVEIAKIREEERVKKEKEKAIEAENKAKRDAILAEEKAKKEAEIARIKEFERKKREEEKKAQLVEKAKREAELTKLREEERIRKEAEKKKQEEERARQAALLAEEKARKEEEAKYTDEYLQENLYPKTKYNKF